MEIFAALLLGGFWLFFIFLWLFIMLVAFGGTILWIWALIDVAKREFKNKDDKTLWILIVVLTGLIGAIIYYFMIYKKYQKNDKKEKSDKLSEKKKG